MGIGRTIAIGTLSGLAAGIIAGGIGSRLVMRIIAVNAGAADQGAVTEADAIVGKITAEGTIGLILFGGGLAGTLGGLMYIGMRRWLADAGRWRGIAYGVLLLAMFGWGIIKSDNRDFVRFGHTPLNIILFASLFLVFGLLLVPVSDWISRALKPPSMRLSGLVSLTAIGVGLVFAVQIIGLVVLGFQEEGSTRVFFTLAPAYAVFVMPSAGILLARASGAFQRLSDLRGRWRWLTMAIVVLAFPVVLGVVLDVQAVLDILAANQLPR